MLTTNRVHLWCAAVLACLIATPSFAQPADKRTTFTFSGPVAIPGVTLPPGSYLFRLADAGTSNRVVQVLSGDGTKPYAMFFTIPAERLEPPSEPEVRFMETASGMPAAIRTWWYPGDRIGYEFIYPKEQARKLAMGAAQPVLTTEAETTTVEQTNTPDLSRISSSGQESTVNADAAPTASAPSGTTQEGEIAASSLAIQSPSAPAGASAAQAANRRTQLPKTASPLPMIALVGTFSLMSAAALRAIRTSRRNTRYTRYTR